MTVRGRAGRHVRGRQLETQGASGRAPVFAAVRQRIWPREGLRKETPAFQPWKAEPFAGANGFLKEMIARIPAGGDGAVKVFCPQFPVQAQHFRPRPAPEMVFGAKRRPRRGKRHDLHRRPEARAHFLRERLSQQRHLIFFRRRTDEGRGNHQIAQPPKFKDEQFSWHTESQGSNSWANAGRLAGPEWRNARWRAPDWLSASVSAASRRGSGRCSSQ